MDGPNPGAGSTEMYSDRADIPRPNTMNRQPAFSITSPMQNTRAMPDQAAMAAFQYGAGQPGFGGGSVPTFFPVGNRSSNSASDPWSGKPYGLRMLVPPPTRYTVAWRNKLTVTDVRLPNNRHQRTRGGTPTLGAGS